jgi:hypothetical protein
MLVQQWIQQLSPLHCPRCVYKFWDKANFKKHYNDLNGQEPYQAAPAQSV